MTDPATIASAYDVRKDFSAVRGDHVTPGVRVLHLIHETSFGGVESAAEHLRLSLGSGVGSFAGGSMRTPASSAGAEISYRVAALEESPAEEQVVRADVTGRGVNSPLAAIRLLREVRRSRPDVLVTSLWRSVALGALAKILSPSTLR